MKQLHIALGALALAATLSTQTAKADSFSFVFGPSSIPGDHGTGTLTGSEVTAGPFQDPGEFRITGAQGNHHRVGYHRDSCCKQLRWQR